MESVSPTVVQVAAAAAWAGAVRATGAAASAIAERATQRRRTEVLGILWTLERRLPAVSRSGPPV
ncbi:hypothetical protein GCM10028772_03640 [Nocardioides ultimimeridianus]